MASKSCCILYDLNELHPLNTPGTELYATFQLNGHQLTDTKGIAGFEGSFGSDTWANKQ